MPANLVFRRKIWGARDNGIPPRSTPVRTGTHFYEHALVMATVRAKLGQMRYNYDGTEFWSSASDASHTVPYI